MTSRCVYVCLNPRPSWSFVFTNIYPSIHSLSAHIHLEFGAGMHSIWFLCSCSQAIILLPAFFSHYPSVFDFTSCSAVFRIYCISTEISTRGLRLFFWQSVCSFEWSFFKFYCFFLWEIWQNDWCFSRISVVNSTIERRASKR